LHLEKSCIEQFPSSGMGSVCHELYNIADEEKSKVELIKKPMYYYILAIFNYFDIVTHALLPRL